MNNGILTKGWRHYKRKMVRIVSDKLLTTAFSYETCHPCKGMSSRHLHTQVPETSQAHRTYTLCTVRSTHAELIASYTIPSSMMTNIAHADKRLGLNAASVQIKKAIAHQLTACDAPVPSRC